MAEDIESILNLLREARGDTASIDVKSAAGGLPESLGSTLSALANMPGGGLIILGLDERAIFRPSGLSDPQGLKQALASAAELADELDLTLPTIRHSLRSLRADGLVEQVGGRGKSTGYRRVAD